MFVPKFLCAKPKFLTTQWTAIALITLDVGTHVRLSVSFINITICTKITMVEQYSIMCSHMPIQVPC